MQKIYFSLLAFSFPFSTITWAQTSTVSTEENRPTQSLSETVTSTKAVADESLGWSYSIETLQHQPMNTDKQDGHSVFSNSLGYKFDSTYSLGVLVEFSSYWTQKARLKDIEAEAAKAQESTGEEQTIVRPKNTLFNDTYVSLTREDLVGVTLSAILPTSDDAKKAGRDMAFSIEPGYTWQKGPLSIGVRSEWAYFANRYATVEDKAGGEATEKYAIYNTLETVGTIDSKWTIYSKYIMTESWKKDSNYSQSFSWQAGPQFKQNKNVLWGLYYVTEDSFSSDTPVFHNDVSAVNLGLELSI